MVNLWQKRLIDFYIIREILTPFLSGIAIITVIMLSSFLFQLTDLIILKDIPLILVLKLLFYQLPAIIVETFPIAILFATITGMGRLNRENEFTALRMGGISLYRLVLPLVILGVVISLATFLINEEVVPWSNHEAQNIIRRSLLKQAMPDIQENVFFKGPEGRLYYVSRYEQKKAILHEVVIYNFSGQQDFPEIITANSGRVIDNRWLLEGGFIHQYNDDGHLTLESRFEVMEFEPVNDPASFFGEQRTPAELSRAELKKEIDLFRKSGINVNSLMIDYHLKLSMPLAALIFILIGTLLSLSSTKNRSSGVILTIIIVFFFYLMQSLSRSFGRNGQLSPLLAAWLPDLVFGILGMILLIWREKWQKWFFRFLNLFTIISIFLLICSPGIIAESKLILKGADHLHYLAEEGRLELNGEITAQYQNFYIKAEELIIKQSNGEDLIIHNPEEILIKGVKLSGCNLDEPHYYFSAREVILYPEDHLIARNVVFRELNGKLPLFYWPYLYLSLKEENQRLIPQPGYSATRGWFLKTTYNYWYKDRLPGQLYLDYYTISSFAGGFKQYFFYEPDLKGSFYLYGQENRTELPGLFIWQGAVDLEDSRGNWQSDTSLDYTCYHDYGFLKGSTDISSTGDKQQLDLNSLFKIKDYYLTDVNDDKELGLDFSYRWNINPDWYLNLNYNQDYLYNEEGLKKRCGSKSYLARNKDDLDLRIIMERYAPRFSEDDQDKVSFYRWPEISLKYRTRRPVALDYQLLLGRYYEDSSGIEGYRGLGEVSYTGRWYPSENLSLSTVQTIGARLYQTGEDDIPRLFSYESKTGLVTELTDGLTWNNQYTFLGSIGETPFRFDQVDLQERINSNLYYRNRDLNARLSSGFDLYRKEYIPLSLILNWQVKPAWYVGMGTSYDLNSNRFGDLALTSKYQDEVWQINSALRLDLGERILRRFDNQLVFDLNNDWYFALNASYDHDDNIFKQANLLLKKTFHCREIGFSYDYLNREFTIEYRINLFPEHGIKLGSSEDEPFMFDFGIEDLLEFE